MKCENPLLSTHQKQLSVIAREDEIMSTSRSVPLPADSNREELMASRAADNTGREEMAGIAFANTTSSSSSLLTVRTSKRNNKKNRSISLLSRHIWIIAMMVLLLYSSSFHHQSESVLVGAITTNTAEMDNHSGADNDRAVKMMMLRRKNIHTINNGIQRKRGGERRATRLDRQQQQQLQQLQQVQGQQPQLLVNHEQSRQAVSSLATAVQTTATTRNLQEDDPTTTSITTIPTLLCTCSPQIFNIKITLTSTDPCTTTTNDDLLPNAGIENTLCLYTNPVEEGVYPPVPPIITTLSPTSSPVDTTMRPTTSSPVGSAATTTTTTMKPTDGTTNDPFKPPPPPDLPQPQGNIPTYSPTVKDMTFAPTLEEGLYFRGITIMM